jgi:hypothetical protein
VRLKLEARFHFPVIGFCSPNRSLPPEGRGNSVRRLIPIIIALKRKKKASTFYLPRQVTSSGQEIPGTVPIGACEFGFHMVGGR